MVTRASRPLPSTRPSSITATGVHTVVKTELGSPFSGLGSGNESDNDRGGNTNAASNRRDSSAAANESDGDFIMDKAPRSLRGITSIADSHTPIPSGLGVPASASANSSGYDSPYQSAQQQYGQYQEEQYMNSHPSSYMMHNRRHTVPDASRALFNATPAGSEVSVS
jgi:hypothetical protein